MATSFKNLDSAKDSVVTRNLLHEAADRDWETPEILTVESINL